MTSKLRAPGLPSFLFATVVVAATPACTESSAKLEPGASAAVDGAALVDAPLAAYQGELFDLAARAAAAFPLELHHKSRGRAQERVVAAALELDQPRRALEVTEDIENWRRGNCLADIAFWCAERDQQGPVPALLAEAEAISEWPEEVLKQAWRSARIRTKIACTHVLLGDFGEAARLQEGAEAAEIERVNAVKASLTSEEDFELAVESLDSMVATASFEQAKSCLSSYAELYDRFYAARERRELVQARIESAWERLPSLLRMDVLMRLATAALEHDDADQALQHLAAARGFLTEARLTAEAEVPLRARLSALSFRAGDEATARAEAEAAMDLFEAQRETIIDMFRGESLRPLAEAYASMGDNSAALAAYGRALDEGLINPNSRPRADDLINLALSMAASGVEPDAELWQRMRDAEAGLVEPW